MSVFDEELKWLASSTGFSQPFRQYVTLASTAAICRGRDVGPVAG